MAGSKIGQRHESGFKPIQSNILCNPDPCKPNAFADFFETKVNNIYNKAKIDQQIYNSKNKLNFTVKFFMADSDILQCIKTIKIKNCEGVDWIPQRILVVSADHLVTTLTFLFKLIYTQKEVPVQW